MAGQGKQITDGGNMKPKTAQHAKPGFTPGPWNWRGHICTGIEGPDSQVIADVGLACGAISKSEAQANARLIAASPIMYDYIKERAAAGDEKAQAILGAI